MKQILAACVALSIALAAHAAEPHPVKRSFNVAGVKTDAEVQKIYAALKRVPSVTAVEGLTPKSGHIIVSFDTHHITSGLVAQTIMDQGGYTVSWDFEVPEYAQHADKLDALFRKVEKERQVKIEAKDKARGLFTLTYLPVDFGTIDPSQRVLKGFNYGHLGHAIHDPAPKGMGLTFRKIEAGRPAAKKSRAKTSG